MMSDNNNKHEQDQAEELSNPGSVSFDGNEGKQDAETSGVKDADALKKELEVQKDKYLRLYAEFENFKRRTSKERIDLIKTAGQEIIAELIGVLDDFDRAQKIADEAENSDAYPEGMRLVHHKLQNILHQRGLSSMNSTGAAFDPEWHEAIAEIPAPSPDLTGKVVDTVEKGYVLSDKIIRFAKVVVGK